MKSTWVNKISFRASSNSARKITHARNDFRLALLSPFSNLGVDLVPEFRLDLSRVACEKGEETLCPAIDDIDFVQ